MASSISASVGPKQPNKPADVKAVQALLNRCSGVLIPTPRLKEDGIYSANVEFQIKLFQSRVLKMAFADGIVSSANLTWGQLVTIGEKINPANVTAFVMPKLQTARTVKAAYGVPVAVLLAQGALETGWGQSVVGNAYFGIKGHAASGSSTFTTTEYVNGKKVTIKDEFRAYQNFDDSAKDYGQFLANNPRYSLCFSYKYDPLKFASQLAQAGYATDPAYAQKLRSIILSYGFLQYDA